jgi:NitT/TauT family transport system ATP-binding protein
LTTGWSRGAANNSVFIFQELGLFPWLTVAQNIEFGLKMQGLRRDEREERVRQYFRMVQLSQFSHCYIRQLSGECGSGSHWRVPGD